ncbi:glycosyl hydrolase catalytic core-domain-containing protein [Mycena capillaripes]|nr:glycosyl hydrolase catalytic core-domain-containing protein [Mycena capillaripes]
MIFRPPLVVKLSKHRRPSLVLHGSMKTNQQLLNIALIALSSFQTFVWNQHLYIPQVFANGWSMLYLGFPRSRSHSYRFNRFVERVIYPPRAALPTVHGTAPGLAWATDNNMAPVIGGEPKITWYHHWEDGSIPQMPAKTEYVPMFWGTSKWDKWSSRKAEMAKHTPQHLLGFNEPENSRQANMSPTNAADVWMQEIHPWAAKGVKLGSPAVAGNLDWTMSFLDELKKRGGHVDFVTVHWSGSYQDIAGFKKFISSAHSRFGYNIWVTELGITSGSNVTPQQMKEFMMNAFSWMDSVGYVERASYDMNYWRIGSQAT